MRRLLKDFLADERGATAIEYTLIGVMISIAIMVGAGAVGNSMNNMFSMVGNKVGTVSNGIQ